MLSKVLGTLTLILSKIPHIRSRLINFLHGKFDNNNKKYFFLKTIKFPFGIFIALILIRLYISNKDQTNFFYSLVAEPWSVIFCFGVLSSLWTQITIEEYFHFRQFFKDVKVKDEMKYFKNSQTMRYSSVFLVFLSMFAAFRPKEEALKDYFFWGHIICTLVYLLIIFLWDSFYYNNIVEAKRDGGKSKFFKECNKQLKHVDKITFAILLLWSILIFLTQVTNFYYENWEFKYHKYNSLIYNIKEPLMGGVIGFHAAFSVAILVYLFDEWKNGRVCTEIIQYRKKKIDNGTSN